MHPVLAVKRILALDASAPARPPRGANEGECVQIARLHRFAGVPVQGDQGRRRAAPARGSPDSCLPLGSPGDQKGLELTRAAAEPQIVAVRICEWRWLLDSEKDSILAQVPSEGQMQGRRGHRAANRVVWDWMSPDRVCSGAAASVHEACFCKLRSEWKPDEIVERKSSPLRPRRFHALGPATLRIRNPTARKTVNSPDSQIRWSD